MKDKRQVSFRPLEEALPLALLAARTAVSRQFKPPTDEVSLSQPQWRVLRALAENGTLEAHEIAERCVLMRPSVSRIVKELYQRGLIEKADTHDRREKPWVLTEAGQTIFDEVSQPIEDVYREIEDAFGQAEMKALVKDLRRLVTVCGSLPRKGSEDNS